MKNTRTIERRLGDGMRARLPRVAAEVVMFTLKQGWACFYGGLLLVAMVLTQAIWDPAWPVARYDALLGFAIVLQILFFTSGLETWDEVKVIALFHVTGTIMEVFKVHAGSWEYPGAGVFKLFEVPLFSGFMYAAVGSYIARVIRIFDMRFAPYPPYWASVALAVAIYVNFFSHHFGPDIRNILFVATVVLFARTRIWFRIGAGWLWLPMPAAAFLASFFMWVAENIGTMTKVWVYAGQDAMEMVRFAKMGSWYLLLFVSFVTVSLVMREALMSGSWRPKSAPRVRERHATSETRQSTPRAPEGSAQSSPSG